MGKVSRYARSRRALANDLGAAEEKERVEDDVRRIGTAVTDFRRCSMRRRKSPSSAQLIVRGNGTRFSRSLFPRVSSVARLSLVLACWRCASVPFTRIDKTRYLRNSCQKTGAEPWRMKFIHRRCAIATGTMLFLSPMGHVRLNLGWAYRGFDPACDVCFGGLDLIGGSVGVYR